MTLLYKLFNKPGNFDEFVDKAKKTGQTHAQISIKSSETEGWNYYHKLTVTLMTKNSRLNLEKYKTLLHSIPGYSGERIDLKLPNTINALTLAVDTAEKLQNLGLETKIDSYDIGEIKKKIENIPTYARRIKQEAGYFA